MRPGATRPSGIENGPHICSEASRRMACDATLLPVQEDETGAPMSVGRRTRTIPPALRRALRLRDGGDTALHNRVQFCRHHHRLVHDGGFNCRRQASGEIVFENPRGMPLESAPSLPQLPSGRRLELLMEDIYINPDIDADTCVSKWQGG